MKFLKNLYFSTNFVTSAKMHFYTNIKKLANILYNVLIKLNTIKKYANCKIKLSKLFVKKIIPKL